MLCPQVSGQIGPETEALEADLTLVQFQLQVDPVHVGLQTWKGPTR
jgi:hypothetical protein